MPRASLFTPPQRWLDTVVEMLELPTVSFHEQNVMRYIAAFAGERGLNWRLDRAGNLLVDYPGVARGGDGARGTDGPREAIVFSAHIDHPGFYALEMIGSGRLRAYWVGRVPEPYILGAAVVFYSGGEPASQACPDLCAGMDTGYRLGGQRVRGRVTEVLGVNEEKDVTAVEVEVDSAVLPGSIGTWDLPGPEVSNGKVLGLGVDDVAGAAALLCMLDQVQEDRCPVPVTCVFTRGEEGGFLGCIEYCRSVAEQRESLRERMVAGEPIDPATIPQDVAGPGFSTPKIIGIEMSMLLRDAPQGSGPIVRVGDKRSVFGQHVTDWCFAAARGLALKDASFRFQRKLMDGGTCESSVFEAWLGNAGGLCLPLGNYHNIDRSSRRLDREFIDVGDYGNLIRLCVAMVEFDQPITQARDDFRSWCSYWSAKHTHLFRRSAEAPEGVEP